MSLAAIQAQENRTLARRIMPKAAGVKPGPQPSRKAAKRARTKCMKKARPKSRRGKASCMPGQLRPMWLAHVHKKGTCWLHACLVLTHVLCLRVTEALRLRASDFNWKNRTVWIAPLKGQCAVRKPLLSALLPVLRHLRAHGLACRRTRPRGVLGKAPFTDVWKWAKGDALLFPSVRRDCKTTHRNKDTVCKVIQRLRKTFIAPTGVWLDTSKVRSHCGRQRMVQDLKLASVPEKIAMLYARIADTRLG